MTDSPAPTTPPPPAGPPAFRELPAQADAGALRPVTDAQHVRDLLGRLTPADLPGMIDRLVAAGAVADRWESPDLIAQLRAAASATAERAPKVVLCGAIDLDPALPFLRTLAADRAMDIAAGAAAVGRLTGATRVVLAVPEDMSPAGITALRAAAEAASVRLFPLPEEYPLAHPSLLIHRVMRRRLTPGKLPIEAGVIVLDAPAAIAVARSLLHGEAMRRVPVGVYDGAAGRPHLVWTNVGIKLVDLLATLDLAPEATSLWAGHILRDVPIDPDAAIGSAELTIFAAAHHPAEPAAACLRCGWCVEACPVRIHPAGLLDAAQQQDPVLAETHGLRSCIECGICSYVCPSRLPLLQSIRGMRG